MTTKQAIIFENIYTKEQYECDDITDTKTIDGQIYINVKRPGTNRLVLIRRESLTRVNKRHK